MLRKMMSSQNALYRRSSSTFDSFLRQGLIKFGFWFALILLPLQLAGSSDDIEFVLNSVAAWFIIEFDNTDDKEFQRTDMAEPDPQPDRKQDSETDQQPNNAGPTDHTTSHGDDPHVPSQDPKQDSEPDQQPNKNGPTDHTTSHGDDTHVPKQELFFSARSGELEA